MSLTQVDYLIRTNEDWRDSLELTTGEPESAVPVDLTGSTFRAEIRSAPDLLTVILEASTENDRLVISDPATDGILSWNISTSVMAQLKPGLYVYDIVWTQPNGVVDTFVAGNITIERGVTR